MLCLMYSPGTEIQKVPACVIDNRQSFLTSSVPSLANTLHRNNYQGKSLDAAPFGGQ